MDEKKSYYVQLPGSAYGQTWDEEKYNRNADKLHEKYPDAVIMESSPYKEDYADTDQFHVTLPGDISGQMWDGAKLRRNREKLLQKYPDAQIVPYSPISRENFNDEPVGPAKNVQMPATGFWDKGGSDAMLQQAATYKSEEQPKQEEQELYPNAGTANRFDLAEALLPFGEIANNPLAAAKKQQMDSMQPTDFESWKQQNEQIQKELTPTEKPSFEGLSDEDRLMAKVKERETADKTLGLLLEQRIADEKAENDKHRLPSFLQGWANAANTARRGIKNAFIELGYRLSGDKDDMADYRNALGLLSSYIKETGGKGSKGELRGYIEERKKDLLPKDNAFQLFVKGADINKMERDFKKAAAPYDKLVEYLDEAQRLGEGDDEQYKGKPVLEIAFDMLNKKAGGKLGPMEYLAQESAIAQQSMPETSGFGAWLGSLVPMIGATATGMGLSAVSPAAAGMWGKATMGSFAVGAAGNAMEQARMSGASDSEVLASGLAAGGIMYGMTKIPYNKFTQKAIGASTNATSKQLAEALNNPESPIYKETELLWKNARKAFGTANLFSKEHFKEWAADAVGTSANFATMGALEAAVPTIYANPDEYPALNEMLRGAVDGALDGLAFGAVTASAAISMRHSQNIKRWKDQGGIMIVGLKDGSVAEIIAKDGQPIKASDLEAEYKRIKENLQYARDILSDYGEKKYTEERTRLTERLAREVSGVNTMELSQPEFMAAGADKHTYTLLHNGKVVTIGEQQLHADGRIVSWDNTLETIKKYNEVLRDIAADINKEGYFLEAGKREAEQTLKDEGIVTPPPTDGFKAEDLSGDTMTDAQVNAAIEYNVVKGAADEAQNQRRADMSNQISDMIGQPYWRSNQPEGVDKPIETVTSIKYADGREVYVINEQDGKYATVDEEGKPGFIERDKIETGLQDGSIAQFNENIPIEVYLDGKITEQDMMAEQERIAQEFAENLTAIVDRIQQDMKVNIGSPEAEYQAPIIEINPTIDGGVVVQTEDGPRAIPWKEVAEKLDMPFEPKTNERLINEKVEADRAVKADMQAEKGEPLAAEGAEPVATSPEPVASFDDPVANEMGIPAEFLTTTKKGRNVVNTALLWQKNPALLIRYNDQTNTLGMSSEEYLTAKVAQVETEIGKQQALLQKEVLTTNDEDKKEDYKDKIEELTNRRDEIAGILQPHIEAREAREAAEKAAAEAARAEKEQEKADREAIKAEEQDASLRVPMNLEEAVANFISGIKPNSLDKADFARELGWGDEEMKRFFPYWAKAGEGMTVNDLAQRISHDDTSGYVPMDINADTADTQAIRDAILSVFQASVRPTDVKDYTKNANLQRRAEAEAYAKGLQEAQEAEVPPVEDLMNPTISEPVVTEGVPAEAVQEAIATAEAQVDTNPTDAQKEAGNYSKGHLDLDGYKFTIENPKGSVRSGKDASGKEWSQVMNNTYGYIRGTEGVDGDHIDMFLSDNPTEGSVFVIDQVDPKTGKFDEHKVMYGFPDAESARAAYLSNYEEGWQGLGTITEVTKDEFRKWIDSSHRKTKPFSEYKSVKAEGAQNEAAAAPVVEDMPEDLFSLLGTTREQAVMDSIQDKMDAIHKRLAEVKDDAEREAIIKEKQQLLKNLYDSLGMDAQVETRSTIVEAYKEGGRSERNIQQLEHALEYSKEEGENMRGFYDGRTTIFINTDDIVSVRSALTARGHEDQHRFNKLTGALAGVEAVAPPISEIYAAVRKLSGSNYYAGDNVVAAADELVANAREIADVYGEDAIARELQKAGINNEEFINFVANIVHNGREASKRNSDSRRHASEYAAQAVDNRQNERDSQAESPAVGGRGAGSLQRGSQAAQGEQELSDGGRIGNLPEQNGRASGAGAAEANQRANHAGITRRAGEDLKPAERARLEDLDRDGTGNPDIIDNLNDATEGTSLFSLDKKNRSLVGLHNISAEKLRNAIRLGGLSNPSVAVIDLNYQNHFEYGDITFLLPSSLVDKRAGRNAGTWVRDAWTPTFPKITFHETKESQKNLKELLKDLPKDLRFLIDRKIYDFINEDTYHSGLEYIFLKEKGMEPEIQVNPRKYPNASEKEFFEKYLKQPEMSHSKTSGSDIMDAYEALSPEERKMANMYVLRDGDMSKIEHALEMEKKWPHLKEVHEEPLGYAQLDSFLYKIMRDERDAGQENIGLTIEKAIEIVGSDKALQDEFNAWQDKTINDLGYEAKMFIGYTDNGRKYKKATLENVSKEMKKEGSNGAQQSNGLSFGSILASMAKKMNSLSEIRANRDRLVSMDEYKQKREELMDKAKEFFFTFYDNNIAKRDGLYTAELVAADYVRDFFIKGHSIDKVVEDFNREQKKSLTLTDEEKAAFNAFRKELQDAPTDMFETKFERPVYVNEFAAAVIPDDTPLDVRQALEQTSLKLYEYKGDERSDERAAAVRKAAEENDGVLFSFIGWRGAEAMDIEDKTRERMDNLAVARQMEKDKATPGAIKWATGWERGVDSMWRYEIPDFTKLDLFGDVMYDKRNPDHVRYKELLRKTNAAALMPESHEPLTTEEMDEFNKLYRKYNGGVKRDMLQYGMLEDFIDADDLFKAYPQLRHYTLRFEDLPDRVGGYAEKRGVVLNMKNRFQYEKISDDLLHEIQHEIQDIEGFSLGTSLKAAERKAQVLNSQSNDALTGREWDFVDLVRLWVIRDAASKAANPLDHWLAEWHKDGLYSDELYKEMIEGKSADELKKLYNQLLIKSKKKQVLSSWDVYKRTAGEVEARNASRRRRFTLEERRTSAAENTEDVSRADQILNMPASSLLDWTDDEDFSIAMQSQKQPGKTYIKVDEDDIAFSLSKSNRGTIEKWLDKREDLSKAQKAAFVGWLDGLSNPTLQLATARWFTQGAIRLPEDMPKVEQAVSVAGKAKVDPLQYKSPMELLDAHADFKATEKRINPDEVSTLHKAKEFKEHGITVYDVDDSEESRQNMRQIINTHFGKEASPWCLLQGDGNGNLTEQSAQYWEHYNGYPKQVAFKDGKLLAFSANDSKERLWWDRQDTPHYDIPAGWGPIKGDALGREVQYVYSENGMLKPEEDSFMKKGNQQNGEYTEWYPNGNLSEHGFYKNGKKDGVYEVYNDRLGYLYSRVNYKEGVQDGLSEYFHSNGNLLSRTYWKDGRLEGKREIFYGNGSLNYIRHYKNGNYDGLTASYNNDGSPIELMEYKDGQPHGKHEIYYPNGKQVNVVEYYDDGKLHGAKIKYNYHGGLRSIENYVHGARQGVQEYYDYGPGKLALRTTEKDNIVRKSEGFNADGQLSFIKRYNEYGEPDGVWKFFTRDGKLDRMIQYENGVVIRDLLAEGIPSWEVEDDINFSLVTDKDELDRLEKEPTIRAYRAMALVDGKLYPPMSQKEPNAPSEKGQKMKVRPASELGKWEKADEAPEKAYEKDGKWYFDLKKTGGKSDVNGVLYNPYIHTSASPLNDQFSSASNRPELVTVEVEVPMSELAGKYKADKANDSVGAKDWHSGSVTAQLGEGRQVILSRWAKPVRIVPDGEVAAMIAPKLKEKNITVPYNVVTPSLRAELEKLGVKIGGEQDEPMFSLANKRNEIFVSNAAKAVEGISIEKATPEQWLKMIEKNGGLKAGEDKWIGLSDWLKASDKKTITKQEVLDYINQNKIQIEEVNYGGSAQASFENDVQERIGRGRSLEQIQGEIDQELRLAGDELEGMVQLEIDTWLEEQMEERYGDDFSLGYWISDGRVYYHDADETEVYEAVENNKPIHSTRLDYTTDGLENKREIALTVPTIEPWNKNDQIHFGDAGEGRAIAWIRFGDAEVSAARDAAEKAYEDAKKAWTDYKQEVINKYALKATDSKKVADLATDEENAKIKELMLDWREKEKAWRYGQHPSEKVLFIDEIQSKRHQEARENGGYRQSFDEYLEEKGLGFRETDDAFELYRKNDGSTHTSVSKLLPEAKDAESAKAYIARLNYGYNKGIPAAPFEKNWQELAMKRMLRLAAEEGYDYVAWTTGDQQAERYNLGGVVKSISISDFHDYGEHNTRAVEVNMAGDQRPIHLIFDEAGNIVGGQSQSNADFEGKTAFDIFGKDLAIKILSATKDSKIKDEGLRIGGEGMRGFYDQMLPAFMNKYGKKWGVKVEDIDLPDLEDGLTAHAVPVTEEMKASVMEGQPMFSLVDASNIDRSSSEYRNIIEKATERINKRIEQLLNEKQSHRPKEGDLADHTSSEVFSPAQAGALSTTYDAKIRKKIKSANELIDGGLNFVEKVINDNTITPETFGEELVKSLALIQQNQDSKYIAIEFADDDSVKLRIANHSADARNVLIRGVRTTRGVSIVLQGVEPSKIKFRPYKWANVVEYVYEEPSHDRLVNIAKSIFGLIDEGYYYDLANAEKRNISPRNRDLEYLDAVQSGDIAKAQQMVDEAARSAFPESAVGKAVLHGTKNLFRAFDLNKIGSNTDAGWLGRGFYFYGNNPTYASQYANFDNPKGGYIIRAYLNIQNLYWASVEDFRRLAEANDPKISEEFTQQLKDEGYDGVYYNGDGNEEWVAFYPNQIKSAEPVTYDEEGNVIPLSERFNPNTDDINFSLTSRQDALKAVDEKGLAGIMDADEAREFRKNIYEMIPVEIRSQIVDQAFGSDLNIKNALNDYLEKLAQAGPENDETGLLRELYNQIRDLSGNENLTDADCRYIIWREAAERTPLSFITDVAYKARFGAGKKEVMARKDARRKEILEAVKNAMPNTKVVDKNGYPKVVYHGTVAEKPFRVFNDRDIYLISKAPFAEQYTHRRGGIGVSPTMSGRVMPVFVNLENPLTMDANRRLWRNLIAPWPQDGTVTTEEVANYAREHGYDGVIIKNVRDNMFDDDRTYADDIIVFDKKNVKSAGPTYIKTENWHYPWETYDRLSEEIGETYDENGNVIPLEERFDLNKEDIMFSFTKEFGDATEENREKAGEAVAAAAEALKETKEEASSLSKAKGILAAMRGQKAYDKATVDSIVRLAKGILKEGKVSSLSRTEVNRLLGLVNASTGKSPMYVNKYADQLLDNMLDIIVKDEEAKLEDLINIKDKTVNQQGVEAQGKLDLLGQETMKALRAYRTKSLEDIQARQSEISDQLSSANDALRKRAWAEQAGLELAEQYVNTIGQSELEEYGLKQELNELKESKQAGAISKDAYKEFEADTKQAIRENKMDRVDAYRTMAAALSTEVKKSVKARAAFAEAEEARVDAIHHDANRDLYGQSAGIMNKESWLGKVVNKPVFRFFFQPLATFDQMMRMIAKHNVTGEGYLYNRFMRGWLKAREQYLTSLRDGNEKLDAKVSEVFGREMKWVDLYSLDKKLPTVEVRMWDKEKMADIELTQGQLLYIYMVNKMTDGKMKLRKMGITEEKVEAIRDNLDPRFLELADWLQADYLPERRNYYNAVHEKLFGAPMAAIEDYFPLKIAEGDRYEEVDVAKETPESALSSTVTAHIIKRTKNAKMLDIVNANAFDVAMEHLESMEEWAAMAPFRKDLNTLLSYSHFRNQVKNMTTIYGSGNQLWKNFVNVSRIIAGTYNPVGKGTFLTNVSKGITSGKINFRLHTALKQMLSYPAFWTEARADDLAKGLANPLKSWDWCMENLPVFKHRWEKRTIGDTRLMESDSDWKVWKKNFVKKASRYGMTPNALIDAFTIAVGSKAVYDAKYRKYIADGLSEEEADKKAKQDATIIYNQSQQSDEDAFVAAVQKDRTFEAAGITTFRNASMGYQRKVHNAYRTLGRMARGNKEAMIDSAARQYVATEGMEWEQAKARAEKEWKSAGAKAAGDLFIYQFFLNYLWKIGPLGLAYILVGADDDKRKKKLLDPLVTTAITGFFEGLSTGGTTTDVIGGLVSGDNYKQWTFLGNPILQDIQNLGNTIKNKGVDTQSAFEIVSLLAQGWCGVDPHLLSDTYAAVVDAAEGDMGIAKEIAFLLMRISQMPQSTMKDFYIDEIQMTAKEAGKAKAKELAERYVEYKKMRRDPLGEILPKDKEQEKKEKKSDKAATTKLMNEAFPKKNKK